MVSFKVKKVFKRSGSSFPELKLSRSAKKYLESGDFYGDSMIFRLDKKVKVQENLGIQRVILLLLQMFIFRASLTH